MSQHPRSMHAILVVDGDEDLLAARPSTAPVAVADVKAIPGGGIFVVARADSSAKERIAALATAAWEARVPFVLIRRLPQDYCRTDDERLVLPWPDHPANAILDLYDGDGDAVHLGAMLIENANAAPGESVLECLCDQVTVHTK